MREIKFRAWDKAKGRFTDFNDVSGYLLLDHNGKPTYFCQTPDAVIHPPYVGELVDLIEINLFTGLKDKNGKEIYEGDVIKFNLCSGTDREPNLYIKFNPNPQIMRVIFADVWASFGVTDGAGFFNLFSLNDIEILGNTYEHPELLTEP